MPAVVLVFVALSTYELIDKINYSPESDIQVELTAQRFLWKYHYPEYGITIAEQLRLEITPNSHNIAYLRTKRKKLGHDLKEV